MIGQVIQTVALSAAGSVVAVGLWEGWGTFAVLKRAGVAYLAFFTLGALLLMLVRSGALGTRGSDGQD